MILFADMSLKSVKQFDLSRSKSNRLFRAYRSQLLEG